jgi:hypothetical protein
MLSRLRMLAHFSILLWAAKTWHAALATGVCVNHSGRWRSRLARKETLEPARESGYSHGVAHGS